MYKLTMSKLIFILFTIIPNIEGSNTGYGFRGTQIGLTEYDDYITFTPNSKLISQKGDFIYVVWRRSFGYGIVNTYYNFYDGSDWVFGTGDYGSISICGMSHVNKPGSLTLTSAGKATIAYSYYNTNTKCSIVQEIEPGSGAFIHIDCPPPASIGASDLFQPHVAVGYQDYIYVIAQAYYDESEDYNLFFCKSDDSGSSYSSWQLIADNGFGHCIAASRNSPKITVSYGPWYRESLDGGNSWKEAVDFVEGIPDSIKWYLYTSLLYDEYDRLHIVFSIHYSENGYDVFPMKIYHYCSDNTPPYSLIYENPDTMDGTVSLRGQIGVSLGQDTLNDILYVVWTNYLPDDIETITGFYNGEIYGAYSKDYGVSWSPAVNISQTYGLSERSASISEFVGDSLAILYLGEVVAGEADTNNPIMCYTVPAFTGIEENQEEQNSTEFSFIISQNPFSDKTMIHFSCSNPSRVSLKIYDIIGCLVKTFIDGETERGDYTYLWDGRDNLGNEVSNGVYFLKLDTEEYTTTKKLLKVR